MAEHQLTVGGHGGKRPNPGPRPSWFREEMEELIRKLSPDFEKFAQQVLSGEMVEPVVTKGGVIVYVEANVRDKIVLFATIAKLSGLMGTDESPLRAPMQKLIDQVQAIKLIQELNYGAKPGGNGSSGSPIVGNGNTPPHAEGSAT